MRKKKNNERKSDISTVGEAINSLLNNYRLKGRFDEARLIASWEKVVGKAIANRTGKIYIRKQVLFVEITSAPLRHKLNLSKSKLSELLEKEVGPGIIDEIILM